MSDSIEKTMTPTESTVAEMWRDLLGRDDIGNDDDFFTAGGTSLTAIKFLQRVAKRYGPDLLSPEALYADPTLAGVSRAIDDGLGPADRRG